ncbi:MAG TPA: hypothetical protein VNX01_05465 [Bacteroidia bacterium]|nr:hypothetical protein [Bacteroidia bacterium]
MKLSNIKKRFTVKTTGKSKNLSLTDEQYRRLLLLMSLGQQTLLRDDEETEIGLIDIEQHVQSFAGEFNSTDLVSYGIETDMFFGSHSLHNKTGEIIDYYKELVFMSELADRFTARDVKLKRETKEKMDIEELGKIEDQYFSEFENNGIKNLQLIKQGSSLP